MTTVIKLKEEQDTAASRGGGEMCLGAYESGCKRGEERRGCYLPSCLRRRPRVAQHASWQRKKAAPQMHTSVDLHLQDAVDEANGCHRGMEPCCDVSADRTAESRVLVLKEPEVVSFIPRVIDATNHRYVCTASWSIRAKKQTRQGRGAMEPYERLLQLSTD